MGDGGAVVGTEVGREGWGLSLWVFARWVGG